MKSRSLIGIGRSCVTGVSKDGASGSFNLGTPKNPSAPRHPHKPIALCRTIINSDSSQKFFTFQIKETDPHLRNTLVSSSHPQTLRVSIMSSFQDKAQGHISQIDKEVSTPRPLEGFCMRKRDSNLRFLNSVG